MNFWYGLCNLVEHLTWMGIALGIVGYFIYREWNRFQEKIRMMERMTPEQLGDIRRIDAEIEAERKRNSAGNLWFLRLGMIVVGGGIAIHPFANHADPDHQGLLASRMAAAMDRALENI